MNDEKLIRYFDFIHELIVELTDPEVREAYQKWCAAVEQQNALPLFAEPEIDPQPLYNAFMVLARAHRAVSPLT